MKKKSWILVLGLILAAAVGILIWHSYGLHQEKELVIPEESLTESKNLPFSARYIRTNGYHEDAVYPRSRIIFSKEQLDAYCREYGEQYDFAEFLKAAEEYPEAFFEKSSLLVILLEEGSGSVRHKVTGVKQVPGLILADIHREVPEIGTCDMAEWHILVEIPRVSDDKTEGKVKLDGVLQANSGSKLIGISKTDARQAWEDDWGLKLTAKNITPAGLTLICHQRDGNASGTLETGCGFSLEKYEKNQWQKVNPIVPEDSIAWEMLSYGIRKNEDTEIPADWEDIYGELPEGHYRIVKIIRDFRKAEDYEEKLYFAEFELSSPESMQQISCEHENIRLSLPYVPGWEYQIVEYTDEDRSFGINYRPAGADGWISLHYFDRFGVCGTGLKSEPYGTGSMGTYDGNPVWSFIAFPAGSENQSTSSFVAQTWNVTDWWQIFGETAMEILDQAEMVFLKTK